MESNDAHLENLGKQCGCEQSCVLDHDIVTLVIVGNIELVQKLMGWLPDLQEPKEAVGLGTAHCSAARNSLATAPKTRRVCKLTGSMALRKKPVGTYLLLKCDHWV